MKEAFKGTEFKVFVFPLHLQKLVLSIYTFPKSAIRIDLFWYDFCNLSSFLENFFWSEKYRFCCDYMRCIAEQ